LDLPKESEHSMELNGKDIDQTSAEEQIITGGNIYADQVTAQGMINQVYANHVSIQDGAAIVVQSGSMDLTNSGVGVARTEQAVIKDGTAGILVATAVNGDNIGSNLIVSREVHATTIRTTVLLSGHVDGPVETTVDARGAMFGGLAAGIGLGVVLVVARFLSEKLRA
jgi:hypothetical protein